MSEVKTFSIILDWRFKEMVGGYLIIDQLHSQVNFSLGKGTWYAKNYHTKEKDDGAIIVSVDVIKVA